MVAITNPAPARPFICPTSVKTFVGRKPELQALTDLLHNPACRLLTIPQREIGKSALVRALARQQENQFRHGVCLVMLAGVRTQDGFYQAIGEQLGLVGRCRGTGFGLSAATTACSSVMASMTS